MFTKFIVTYTALCVALVGFATASSCGTPDCECKKRLLQEEFITEQSERLHEAEKQLFPNGHYNIDEHMELKKRQEERRLMCKCQNGDIVDNESQCDECSSSSTLEDAIETLSKECIKSQESKISKFKGVFAKTSLLLADKLDNLYKKKAFAIKASKILGCPSTGSGCYDEACEHIDSAISAIGPVRGRKLQVNDHPWTSPNSENAELLQEDPGIWVIPNFLNNDDTIKLANLLEKYRDDTGPSPCSRTAPDGRNCIYFTENEVSQNYEEDEAVFYSNIRYKVQALWPQLNLLETNGIYDVPKDKTDPFGYHWDDEEATSSFHLRGPDGVTVTPKKGTVLTWLSRRSDGEMNKSHAHGIQATAPGSSQLISVHNFARGNTSVQVRRMILLWDCRCLKEKYMIQ